MTYSYFRNKIDHDLKKYSLRYGQTIMNTLSEVWPEKHLEITGTSWDCFYNNNKTETLLSHLEKTWDYETTR